MTPEQSAANEKLYLNLIVFFLCSLFVLGVPYIAMLFLLIGSGLFFAQFFTTLRINRHPAAFLALLIYVLLWGMMVGGFQPASLMNPAFIGGEGRIIVAYMPVFLVFAAPRSLFSEANLLKIFRVLFWVAVLVAPLSLVGLNHTLFGSHHAAGYAAGSLFIIFACLSGELNKKWLRIGLLLAVILLMLANSRTTIVGLALSFATFYYHRMLTPKVLLGGGVALVVVVYAWSFLSPDSFARLAQVFDRELWKDMAEQVNVAASFDVLETASVEKVGTNHNILTRVVLWVRAWGYFEMSPILGVGSFRFNDPGLYFVEVMPFVNIGETYLSPSVSIATAHNSYFQILSEGGIVGVFMYFMPWVIMLRTLRAFRDGSPLLKALRNAGIICILFMGFGALTGHLFAAPSMTLWSTFFASLAIRANAFHASK